MSLGKITGRVMKEVLLLFVAAVVMIWAFLGIILAFGVPRRIVFGIARGVAGVLFAATVCVPSLDLLPHGGFPLWWLTGSFFGAVCLTCLLTFCFGGLNKTK